MHRNRRLAILAASSALALFACRTPGSGSSAVKAESGGQPIDHVGESGDGGTVLLVVSGGWMSCQAPVLGATPKNMFLYDQAMNLIAELKAKLPGTEVKYLLTCLRVKPPMAGTPFWWLRSDRPDQVYQSDVGEYDEIVAQAQTQLGAAKTFMIGHSYGGWMVMQGLSRTSLRATHVLTLDPISAERCKVVNNLPSAETSEFCTTAPTTLDNASIRGAVDAWTNFHQGDGRLHSSAIAEAGDDVPLTFPYGDKSHHRMGFDNVTWQQVCGRVSADLGISGVAHCRPIQIDENGHLLNGGLPFAQLTSGTFASQTGCQTTVTADATTVKLKFSNCAPHPQAVSAELACNAARCSGHLMKLGPAGNPRRIHPLADDIWVGVEGATMFYYYPQGFNTDANRVLFYK